MTAPRRPRSAWLLVGSTPSVWADDPVVAFAEHGLGFGGVPAGRDPEDRCAAGERAPEHAAVAAGLPAGLVDVDDRRALDLLLQPRVRGGERLAGALDDCVHRPGRDPNPEQLPGELGCVTPRDAVTHRERGDRRLEPRPERPPRPGGRLGRGHSRARRAAHPVQPMLAHPDRDRRQLGDLTPGRPGRVDTIRLGELVRTRPAPVGPMLDDLVDLFGREQPPVPTLVSVLPAPSPRGRGGADGGSCDGGNDEFRELRFSRRSSSATRASRRSFASTSRWFASTSSSSRSSKPTAVSRSPSRIASASARSIPANFAATQRVPAQRLNAYLFLSAPLALFPGCARYGALMEPSGSETTRSLPTPALIVSRTRLADQLPANGGLGPLPRAHVRVRNPAARPERS